MFVQVLQYIIDIALNLRFVAVDIQLIQTHHDNELCVKL